MNNVSQFLSDTNNKLSSYDNLKETDYVNTDSFNAKSKFDDIWNAAHEELQGRYSLPAFHLWESGFCQGDAGDDEIFEAKDSINKIDGDAEPVVMAEWDNENDDEIITDIYEYLDKELLKIVEPKTESLIEEYESFCKNQLV